MSDLQCPARIVAVPTDSLDADAERSVVRAVYAARACSVASRLAELAGLDVTIEPGLGTVELRSADGLPKVGPTIESLADLHRGETIVVVCEPEMVATLTRVAGGLTRLAGGSDLAGSLRPPVVIDIDADGWLLVAP